MALLTHKVLVLALMYSLMLDCSKAGTNDDDVYNLLCSRIYFEHPSEQDFPYINALSGVYVKTNRIIDKFPVYENERGNVFFLYRKVSRKFYFSKGSTSSSNFLGVAAESRSSILDSPISWMQTIDNASKPLGDVFNGNFFYYNNNKDRDKPKYTDIKPTCVRFISDCDSKPLVFTVDVKGVQNSTVDNFNILANKFQENRRVYIHSNYNVSNYYIFHHSGYWMIGPDVTKPSGYFSVKSSALKPELITEKWTYSNNKGGWIETDATLQCRGLNDQKCSSSPCRKNFGKCKPNILNESVCICKYGFEGTTCQQRVTNKCGDNFSFKYMTVNYDEGAVTTQFCPSGQTSSATTLRTLLCHKYQDKRLDWYGFPCPPIPTTTTTTTRSSYRRRTTYRRRNWRTTTTPSSRRSWRRYRYRKQGQINIDDNKSLSIAIKVLVIVVPVLVLPILHYCFYSCYRVSKGKELSDVSSLCSLHAYFGMFAWFTFCMCYVKYRLTEYGPSTFEYIFVSGVVFIICGYCYILVETWLSSVMSYLRSDDEVVGDAESFIQSLLAGKPKVTTTARAYHWETRTRQVSYTDANGNTQYRTETYQEQVTTWTGFHSFIFDYWKDVSDVKAIPRRQPGEITRVKLDKTIEFANEETGSAFFEQKNAFINANRHRDVHIEDTTSYDIPDFKEHIMSYDAQQGLPCWMNWGCFCAWSIVCCSWPYRWIMRRHTKKKTFSVMKIISISPLEIPTGTPLPTAPHSVHLQEPPSSLLPPSYDDAVRMTPYISQQNTNPAFQPGAFKLSQM